MSLTHEVLDRSYLISNMFELYILEHPLIEDTPELLELAEKVADSLYNFYQSLGQYNAKHVLRE